MRILQELIQGRREVQAEVLPAELIVRETTARSAPASRRKGGEAASAGWDWASPIVRGIQAMPDQVKADHFNKEEGKMSRIESAF